jgi:hypothetical protein
VFPARREEPAPVEAPPEAPAPAEGEEEGEIVLGGSLVEDEPVPPEPTSVPNPAPPEVRRPLVVTQLSTSPRPAGPSIQVDPSLLAEAEAQAAPPVPPPPPESAPGPQGATPFVPLPGVRRVIVHLLDGSVKRGTTTDLDLGSAAFAVSSPAGVVEEIPRDRVKAIFFMLAPGARPPSPEGTRLRIELVDGRSMVGFGADDGSHPLGVLLTPSDARTGTEVIFVARAGIRALTRQ